MAGGRSRQPRSSLRGRCGFDASPAELDWPTFLVHRQRYISDIHDSYRRRLDAAGIVAVASRGQLLDAHTVLCGQGAHLRADRILLSRPAAIRSSRRSPASSWAARPTISSSWTAAPERVAIFGGGYIAVELAGVLQALGSRVELFARGQRLLSEFDAEVSEQLAEDYRQAGVHLNFGYQLGRVQSVDGGVRLCDADGAIGERFDALLFATGRRANTAQLGLEAAGVAVDANGYVLVDELHATNVAEHPCRRRRHPQPGADAARHRRGAPVDGPPVRRAARRGSTRTTCRPWCSRIRRSARSG